jgi:hypothetical protein
MFGGSQVCPECMQKRVFWLRGFFKCGNCDARFPKYYFRKNKEAKE